METIAFFKTLKNTLDKLSNEEAGVLIKALFAADAGEDPDLSGASVAVEVVFPMIAEETRRLQKVREKRSLARQGGDKTVTKQEQTSDKTVPHNQSHSQSHISPNGDNSEKRKRFVPPTVEEVREYAREKDLQVDAERFVAFYSSKGWMVGKNKMTSWHAALSGWGSRDKPHKDPPKEYGDRLSGIDYSRLLEKEAL